LYPPSSSRTLSSKTGVLSVCMMDFSIDR
jgi:hypothetical protein